MYIYVFIIRPKTKYFFAKKSYGKRDSQRQSRPVNWAVLTGECNKTARLRLLTIFNENDNTSYAIYLSLSYFLLRVCVFTQNIANKARIFIGLKKNTHTKNLSTNLYFFKNWKKRN